jgi:hypothetical protein
MVKKLFLSLVFIAEILYPLSGQKINFSFQSGYGSYSMEELKQFNAYFTRTNILKPELTFDFPAYFYSQPYISFQFSKTEIGLLYSFHSTSARYSIRDYSGSYQFDTPIKGHCTGLFINERIFSISDFDFSIFGKAGICYTKLRLEDKIILSETEVYFNSTAFKAKNGFFEPGIKITYNLWFLNFECFAGFSYSMGDGDLYFTEFENKKLINPKLDSPVDVNWEGVRIGVGVGIELGKTD